MSSTVALVIACLVSLSPAQSPQGFQTGPEGGLWNNAATEKAPEGTLPSREGLDLTGSYLLWWWNRGTLPPLLTTSSPADAGVLGAATTQVLYGGQQAGANPFSGGRFAGTAFLNSVWDLEVGGFFLTEQRDSFSTASDLNGPLLAVPIIDTRTGQPSSIVISEPGVTAGSYTARLISQLWGLHFSGIAHVAFSDYWHLMLSTGVRYADYTEALRLGIRQQSPFAGTFEGAAIPADSVVRGFDRFHCRNQFAGGMLGTVNEFKLGGLIVTARVQCAFGVTRGRSTTFGAGYLNVPSGDTAMVYANVLAQPTNIGTRTSSRATLLPEGGVTVGYQVTRNVQLFAGYDLFYWSNVLRPGDQITRRVNPELVPFLGTSSAGAPAAQPAPVWTSLLAQGVNVGVLLSF
ncbi:MAG: BBP7 family outer membrane beta-barrel protein [Gemmataceae bacterium]